MYFVHFAMTPMGLSWSEITRESEMYQSFWKNEVFACRFKQKLPWWTMMTFLDKIVTESRWWHTSHTSFTSCLECVLTVTLFSWVVHCNPENYHWACTETAAMNMMNTYRCVLEVLFWNWPSYDLFTNNNNYPTFRNIYCAVDVLYLERSWTSNIEQGVYI
jgi:hypothetical protein